MARSTMGAASVVLTYHALGTVPRGAPLYNTFVPLRSFEAHMEFLSRHREVVSLETIVREPPSGRTRRVAITFDDG